MKTSLSPAVSVVIAFLAAAVGACSAVDTTPVPREATATATPAAPSRDFDFDLGDGRYDNPAVAQKRSP